MSSLGISSGLQSPQSSGNNGFPYSLAFGGLQVGISNPKFPACYNVAGLAAGDTDLYTCPAGRKALFIDALFTNPTGNANSPIMLAEVKVSGVYHTFDFVAQGEPAGTWGKSNAVQPFLLAAGETLAVHCSSSGNSIWPFIIEFDASAQIFDARLFSLNAGNNTLFTVPAGKTIILGNFPGATQNPYRGRIWYWNASGGARNISLNVVPNGGSVAAANQINCTTGIGNNNPVQCIFYGGLNPGDFINVNTDANTASQMAYLIYVSL